MIVSLLAAMLLQSAGQPVTVKAYLRDSLHAMTETGAFKGLKPKAELPKPPVAGVMGKGNLVKIGSGADALYFRSAELLTEGGSSGCAAMAAPSSKSGRRLAASDLGSGNGLSALSLPCIPTRR